MYEEIYSNLCEVKRQAIYLYRRGSNLHKHHILPKHSGGRNTEDNYTYLTIREHIIAHFLLWKIYKNPNDLRSMHMLGANLDYNKRNIVGIFCRDNKIGMYSDKYINDRILWAKKGIETQKLYKDTNSFYWWSTVEGRQKRAKLGGMVGGKVTAEQKIGLHNPEKKLEWCSLGGQSHVGKKWIHKDDKKTRCHPNEMYIYISEGWSLGAGSNAKRGKIYGPNKNKTKRSSSDI